MNQLARGFLITRGSIVSYVNQLTMQHILHKNIHYMDGKGDVMYINVFQIEL